MNKHTVKDYALVVPGTSGPSATQLTVSLYLCSSGSNARGKLSALEGRRVSSKSPSKFRDRHKRVAGRKRQKSKQKIELLIAIPANIQGLTRSEIEQLLFDLNSELPDEAADYTDAIDQVEFVQFYYI